MFRFEENVNSRKIVVNFLDHFHWNRKLPYELFICHLYLCLNEVQISCQFNANCRVFCVFLAQRGSALIARLLLVSIVIVFLHFHGFSMEFWDFMLKEESEEGLPRSFRWGNRVFSSRKSWISKIKAIKLVKFEDHAMKKCIYCLYHAKRPCACIPVE